MAQEKDIVLIHHEGSPLGFARIEEILPDIRPDWYHVKLMILQVPLQVVTWLLKNAYINGEEFTMGGIKMRMERIECPEDPGPVAEKDPAPTTRKKEKGKIISITDLKKK